MSDPGRDGVQDDGGRMMDMDVETVAEAVRGSVRLHRSNAVARGVVVDSRRVVPGSVFVAVKGERVDGHDFLAQAASQGAVAALVDHEVPDAGIPQIVVADTISALGDLARKNIELRRREKAPFTVVGITGSVGKTTTKDMLRGILSDVAPTVAPVGSFNNEIGLPLTALEVGQRTRFLIAEMGANHVGEIARLTGIVPPDVAVVLKVGTAHLGEFGSVERIALAKSEIVKGLVPQGVAVLNAGDPRVAAMSSIAPGDVLWFADPDVDVAGRHCLIEATDVRVDGWDRASFTVRSGEDCERIELGIPGRHNVVNALAAATVARHLGVELSRIAGALSSVDHISPHRMDVSAVDRNDVRFTLIDDSFNANPDSMKAGIDGLVGWGSDETGRQNRYRIAVLGAMLELGADGGALHSQVGRYAAEHGVDAVVAVGGPGELDDLSRCLADGAREVDPTRSESVSGPELIVETAHTTTQADALVERIARDHPGSVVLLKGSHASGLSALASEWTRNGGKGGVDRS